MTRPRKPTHLKAVENSRDRRAEKGLGPEPVPTGLLRGSAPPEHFDEEEAKVWHRFLDATPHGLLRRLDAFVLEQFCEAWVVRAKAQKSLKNSALLVKAGSGTPMANPYLWIVSAQSKLINTLGGKLGFSPADRTKIALEEDPGEADPNDKYFK